MPLRLRFRTAAALATLAISAGCAGGADGAGVAAPPATDAPPTSVPATTSALPTTTAVAPSCVDPGTSATVAYREPPLGVDPNLVSLDVHVPGGGCDLPVVVWVHGGGYRVGDKANSLDGKLALAEAHGWVLVSVNYRLTDPDDPASARYPDHYEDVAAALAWVVDEVHRFGGDPDRLVLLGHSAGADIVTNVVLQPDHLASVGLEPDVVDCLAALDTEGFDKVAAGPQEQWETALGDLPDHETATSATYLVPDAPHVPPVLLAERGTPRRRAITDGFAAAVRAAGADATVVDASSLSHQEVNTRLGAPGDDVMTEPFVSFVAACSAP